MLSIPKHLRYINKKPNLIILFERGKLYDYPFNIPEYLESYRDFCRLAHSKFNIFVIRGILYYLGQGTFSRGYLFQNGKFKKYNKKIYAKIIYDKGGIYSNGGKDWRVINKQGIKRIAKNKYTSYLLFKRFSKLTYLVKSKTDFKKYIRYLKTNKVVFKPIYGYEGKGIIIDNKNTLINKIKKIDGLLQEFIDTSKGISGICRSYHDLRVLIMDGKIIEVFIRIPKRGFLLANVARGGRLKEIRKKLVPSSVLKIVKHIDNKFRKFGHRIYSLDLGLENNKPYLIEINDQPGLPYKKCKMYYHKWHKELLKTLSNTIK